MNVSMSVTASKGSNKYSNFLSLLQNGELTFKENEN